MKELLQFIVKEITGSKEITIEESSEDNRTRLAILAKPENIGIIIGKGGNTIRAIRNILRVKATLEKRAVYVEVSEKTN